MAPIAIVPQIARPANPRPIQPVRKSEVLLAVAVIAAMALVMWAGFLLGRMHSRRKQRGRITGGRVNRANKTTAQRGNLRLVSPKRR